MTGTIYLLITILTFKYTASAGPIWKKVFSHDTAGGLFTNTEDAKKKNIHDDDADLFSVLYNLQSMRNDDGVFHFKLCYPELTQYPIPCNEWIQSSNPLLESSITGYAGIAVTWTQNGIGGPFQGLGLSPPSFSYNLIDDVPNNSNWYNSIGSLTYWGGSDTIPGPNEPGVTLAVKKKELYVRYIPSLNSSLPCCLTKSVGGVSYTLDQEKDTGGHNCLENCTYKEDGNPGQIFCFRAGDLEVVCGATPESIKHCKIVSDGPFGGSGGRSFNDARNFQNTGYPSLMQIWGTTAISAIQVTYQGTHANKHGGGSGSSTSIQLQSGEEVTLITGSYGQFGSYIVVCQLTITTNYNSYPRGKQCTGPHSGVITSSQKKHPGCKFAYISGRAGGLLDSITLNWCC